MGKLDCLYDKYKKNCSISWETFNSDQKKYQGNVVRLRNNDFRSGTLRIRYPCALLLVENIVFNPDNGNGSNKYFDPNKSYNSQSYKHHGYVLGFFAAIAIETKNVILDLNKYSIKQGCAHHVLQRFYSHIELADQPFLPKQGPADFGAQIDSAENVLIMNGTLGLSSHHAVHGNNNKNIEFRDLNIINFQVASIALNGAQNIKMKNLNIDGHIDLPVLGNLSAAIFDMKFADSLLELSNNTDIKQKNDALRQAIDDVVEDICSNGSNLGKINPNRESTKIFINESGIPDGNTYGILINGKGVAVNAIASERPEEFDSKNIKIKDVKIKNIKGAVHEIIALSNLKSPNNESTYAQSGIQTDHAGAAFQIEVVTDNNGHYKPNVLSDLQISLGRWSDLAFSDQDGDSKLIQHRNNSGKNTFGTYSIHPAIIAWAWKDGDLTYNYDGKILDSSKTIQEVVDTMGFHYIGNGDSMFHVNKGFFGIRLDKVENASLYNVHIDGVHNSGLPGSDRCGPYTGPSDGGHFAQNKMLGYCGGDVYGLCISACKTVTFVDSSVKDIYSTSGSVNGIMINGQSLDVKVCNTSIDKLVSKAPYYYNLPNKLSIVSGVYVDYDSANVKLVKTTVCETINYHISYLSYKYLLNNNSTTISDDINECKKGDKSRQHNCIHNNVCHSICTHNNLYNGSNNHKSNNHKSNFPPRINYYKNY